MTQTRIAYSDLVGSDHRHDGQRLSACAGLPHELRESICAVYGDIQLSPPQEAALDAGLLDPETNLLVSAATNSGKTLVAVLRIFSLAYQQQARSVLVVPLKAIAEEKLIEFEAIADALAKRSERRISVAITTGDYQQTEDFLGSPPPGKGEIIICTPERLEVMLRNPNSHSWAQSINTFVFDEFHMLGEKRRGATLESLVTRVMACCQSSSILALSATIGGPEKLSKWFLNNNRQLNTVETDYRFPQLHRSVVVCDDKDEFVKRHVVEIAADNSEAMLVFVDTQAATERLVSKIKEWADDASATYFHAGLSLAEKRKRIGAIKSGEIRIVVTTTSLKMGVNFPVSRVIIRDYKLHDGNRRRKLAVSDVLQMMGRAGRREQPGRAFLLVDEEGDAVEYSARLKQGDIAELQPQLLGNSSAKWRHRNGESEPTTPMSSLVLTELAMREQGQKTDVWQFASRTYSAVFIDHEQVEFDKQFSELERSKLIYRVEGGDEVYAVTKLGRTVAQCGISPESGALAAGFLRALITLSEKAAETNQPINYIRGLTGLDLLFLSLSTYELRDSWLPRPSKKAIAETQQFIESLDSDQKPLVNRWRFADSSDFPTRRLLSTLKIQCDEAKQEQVFYQILRTAELLLRHSQGEGLTKLGSEYGTAVGKIENRLKATATWILSCISQICDPAKAYKLEAVKMKSLKLLQDLSLGSTLGELLELKGIGRRTVEAIVDSGVESLDGLTPRKLLALGIDRSKIMRIEAYSRTKYR